MANILWEMIVKMLTHIHMVMYPWWCWHIYKGGGVCRGAGFGAFGKMECLFSIAPDANSCGWLIRARVKKLEVKTS